MKKIPTLFERTFKNHKVTGITDKVTQGFEWVLNGEGIATTKIDGSCCAIINGELYRRYDAKNGKKPPDGAIPCCDPDPITGHWPHWVKCDENNPSDKWFIKAKENSIIDSSYVTFEAIGPHFSGNPYGLTIDILYPHGTDIIDVPRDFDGIRKYLYGHNIEGIVFWKDGTPQCKIKRSDFGFVWPIRMNFYGMNKKVAKLTNKLL